MISIVFTACLFGDPSACSEKQLAFEGEGNITPYTCVMYGQAELAKWQENHPNYRITKFGCKPYVEKGI